MEANPNGSGAPRVLVVDDEPNIVDVISMALRYEGFEVDAAGSGAEALSKARDTRPHVMLLDVMLPDMEGFDVARRLGADRARVPIIFLAARDATEDRVRGLTVGGDDYVTKPFSLEELVARVRAILRRTQPDAAAGSESRVAYHDLSIDDDAHEVRRGDRLVQLTPTEYNLLRYLLVNAGRVVSKAQILDHVWRYDFGGDSSVVETYISYLRKKIDQPGEPRLIQTVRGFGYALRMPRG